MYEMNRKTLCSSRSLTSGSTSKARISKRWTASKAVVLTLLLSLLWVSSASAEASGWSVGVRAGLPELDSQFAETFVQFVDDDSELLGVGVAYRFNEYLAIEAWYQDYGEFNGAGSPCADEVEGCTAQVIPTRSELEGISVRALGYLPISDRFSFYGMVGAIDWSLDVNSATPGGPGRIDEFSDTDLLYGAGFEVDISQRLHAFVEYEILDFDVEVPGVGLRWSF